MSPARRPGHVGIPQLLAQCVSTLVREGREAEADEAIRQGKQAGTALGPYASDADQSDDESTNDGEH